MFHEHPVLTVSLLIILVLFLGYHIYLEIPKRYVVIRSNVWLQQYRGKNIDNLTISIVRYSNGTHSLIAKQGDEYLHELSQTQEFNLRHNKGFIALLDEYHELKRLEN